ncbi:MAG TPA: diacylglycerol kinase [Gemmataceae bacterium]|jgi:diacylglycerol kinase
MLWPHDASPADRPTAARRPCRRWRDKFLDAGRGVKLGVRGHSSFFVHFFCAALVVAAAVALQCDVLQWAILLGCVGAVLTAELFNSALETLFRGLDDPTKQRLIGVLDIAAGAVLLASATAAAVGGLVLGHRLWTILGW